MHVRGLTLAGCVSLFIAVGMLWLLACSAFANLPDNRAYEMVSPVERGGTSFLPDLVVSDASGEHVIVDGGVANALLATPVSWMLETRGTTGWSGVQIGPAPPAEEPYLTQKFTALSAVSENFSRFGFQTFMSLDPRDTSATPGTPAGTSDVYVRNGPTGPLEWASGPPEPQVKVTENYGECGNIILCAQNNAFLAGASTDLDDVVWSQDHPLVAPPASLPGSPVDTHTKGNEVYESVNGADQQLVGLVPAAGSECGPSHGSCVVPPCGAGMGNSLGASYPVFRFPYFSTDTVQGAVSGDGSQVVFTSPDPGTEGEEGCTEPEIYIREEGTSTVRASASEKAGGDPHGPRQKVYVGSAEESGRIDTVFFTSSEELTDDSNTGSEDQGNDLYAYSLETGKLTDVTPDTNPEDANGASVTAFVGSSTDGSLVYFKASGVLTKAQNSLGESAQEGGSNLYVYDAASGTTRFIGPGPEVSGLNIVGGGRGTSTTPNLTSEVTPDGRHFVFVASENLSPYNQQGNSEVYLYDATTNGLACVSCNPSGAAPAGPATLPQESPEGYADGYEVPATMPRSRAVSDDGSRVFFNSPDQLTTEAPSPTPGKALEILAAKPYNALEPNAYEYEDGHLHLIAAAAAVLTVTPSGDDVFFDTLAQLVPQDRDGAPDIYDARVDGGFPTLAAPECSGTSCQGVPATPPIFATPPSVTFNGVGNFPPPAPEAGVKPKRKSKPAKCKAGFVKKHGKCVRKSKAKKSAKGRK
ncbi:MAG TPA: hypothetical protein VK701_04845 [Solirubrobacteraceae bacterium]|jgi:Tol biopolymer transport system component|nr:hypothetical protein [Solirubrobacteraceae bacterium]